MFYPAFITKLVSYLKYLFLNLSVTSLKIKYYTRLNYLDLKNLGVILFYLRQQFYRINLIIKIQLLTNCMQLKPKSIFASSCTFGTYIFDLLFLQVLALFVIRILTNLGLKGSLLSS